MVDVAARNSGGRVVGKLRRHHVVHLRLVERPVLEKRAIASDEEAGQSDEDDDDDVHHREQLVDESDFFDSVSQKTLKS